MSTQVEQLLYDGGALGERTLNGHEDPAGESVTGWADVTYEAMRAMNHITINAGREGIPAPAAYRVLGNLSGLAGGMVQLCKQLGAGLERSLESASIEVYDTKGDPAAAVEQAQSALRQAAAAALLVADHLSDAQIAINSQGYEPR